MLLISTLILFFVVCIYHFPRFIIALSIKLYAINWISKYAINENGEDKTIPMNVYAKYQSIPSVFDMVFLGKGFDCKTLD